MIVKKATETKTIFNNTALSSICASIEAIKYHGHSRLDSYEEPQDIHAF